MKLVAYSIRPIRPIEIRPIEIRHNEIRPIEIRHNEIDLLNFVIFEFMNSNFSTLSISSK